MAAKLVLSEREGTCTTQSTQKNEFRISPAKAQRRKGDGPRPVIPSECEGSNKDFALQSK
jgi:hypothetical protein